MSDAHSDAAQYKVINERWQELCAKWLNALDAELLRITFEYDEAGVFPRLAAYWPDGRTLLYEHSDHDGGGNYYPGHLWRFVDPNSELRWGEDMYGEVRELARTVGTPKAPVIEVRRTRGSIYNEETPDDWYGISSFAHEQNRLYVDLVTKPHDPWKPEGVLVMTLYAGRKYVIKASYIGVQSSLRSEAHGIVWSLEFVLTTLTCVDDNPTLTIGVP